MEITTQILLKNYEDRSEANSFFHNEAKEVQAHWLSFFQKEIARLGLCIEAHADGFRISAFNFKGAKLLNGTDIRIGYTKDKSKIGFRTTFTCIPQFRHYAGYKRLYDNQWQPGKQWSPIPRARQKKLTLQAFGNFIDDLKNYRIHEAELELRINRKARVEQVKELARLNDKEAVQEASEKVAKLKLAGILGLYNSVGQNAGGVVTFVSDYTARFRVSFKHESRDGQPLVAILFSYLFEDSSLKVDSIEFDGDLDPLDALKSAQVIAKATRVAGGC